MIRATPSLDWDSLGWAQHRLGPFYCLPKPKLAFSVTHTFSCLALFKDFLLLLKPFIVLNDAYHSCFDFSLLTGYTNCFKQTEENLTRATNILWKTSCCKWQYFRIKEQKRQLWGMSVRWNVLLFMNISRKLFLQERLTHFWKLKCIIQ